MGGRHSWVLLEETGQSGHLGSWPPGEAATRARHGCDMEAHAASQNVDFPLVFRSKVTLEFAPPWPTHLHWGPKKPPGPLQDKPDWGKSTDRPLAQLIFRGALGPQILFPRDPKEMYFYVFLKMFEVVLGLLVKY